jgi:hypothetical protein
MRPGVAVIAQVVIDPGRGPLAGVLFDRLELPVRRAEHRPAVEGQAGQIAEGELEQMRQVIVGAFLPTRGPDELEVFS